MMLFNTILVSVVSGTFQKNLTERQAGLTGETFWKLLF